MGTKLVAKILFSIQDIQRRRKIKVFPAKILYVFILQV